MNGLDGRLLLIVGGDLVGLFSLVRYDISSFLLYHDSSHNLLGWSTAEFLLLNKLVNASFIPIKPITPYAKYEAEPP